MCTYCTWCLNSNICVYMHTHSWPSHSCVRASSGCRSGDRPGRRASPALWILPSPSPSASRTASRSCIAPLQIQKHKHRSQRSINVKTQRKQVSGWVCIFAGRSEAKCHSSTQLAQQAAADVGQSPKWNRGAAVWAHRAASLSPSDLLLKATRRRKGARELAEGGRADLCLSVLSVTHITRACSLHHPAEAAGNYDFCFRNA